MANIIITGDAIVVKSACTLENIKTAAKFRPEALKLKNEKGSELFKIEVESSAGGLCNYGAQFAGESRDEAGLAHLTLAVPSGVSDVKKYIFEKFGTGIVALNKTEQQLSAAMDEINADKETVESSIEQQ